MANENVEMIDNCIDATLEGIKGLLLIEWYAKDNDTCKLAKESLRRIAEMNDRFAQMIESCRK